VGAEVLDDDEIAWKSYEEIKVREFLSFLSVVLK
jgi:hypothetical protein